MRSVVPWSWSALESYEQCPRAFYEIKLAKNFVEDWNRPYILWGNAVHGAMEHRIRDRTPLPDDMRQWESIAAKLEAAPGDKYPELETAVTEDLQPVGYWDEACWGRGKEDLLIINGTKALAVDYKTGTRKTKTEQLEATAMRVLARFPQLKVVHTAYAWLPIHKWDTKEYRRGDEVQIRERFAKRVADMQWSEKNGVWPAKPSGLCKRSKRPGSTYQGCIVASCPFSEFYIK